ncbi:MAG: hypothetical protein HKN16_06275 [Saprospiraceae bacterium]|nr:hypothetical protein [Saprospiraceae bacterium]
MRSRDRQKSTILRFLDMKYLILLIFLNACSVSFRGVTVPTGVNTFFVGSFVDNSDIVFPTLSQETTDALINKIFKETNLVQEDTDPHIEFSGVVTARISSEAPQAGQASSLDRLEITLSVEYTNNLNDEDNWKSSFSNFENFDPGENLDAIRDDLVASILDNVMEDVYQKAFTNW